MHILVTGEEAEKKESAPASASQGPGRYRISLQAPQPAQGSFRIWFHGSFLITERNPPHANAGCGPPCRIGGLYISKLPSIAGMSPCGGTSIPAESGHCHGKCFVCRHLFKKRRIRFQNKASSTVHNFKPALFKPDDCREFRLHSLNGHLIGPQPRLPQLFFMRHVDGRKLHQSRMERLDSRPGEYLFPGDRFESDRAEIHDSCGSRVAFPTVSFTVKEPTRSAPTITS